MTEMMWAVNADPDQPLSLKQVEKPVCGAQDILVDVAAAGLNRADLLQRQGRYPPPPGASPIMGLECAGTIVACGAEVTQWQTGQRVCGLMAGGGYAEYATLHQGSVFAVPEEMSLEQAAALPEAMMTVWANVFEQCGFRSGDALLVHGGTSGIGTMAIQMARYAGAGQIMVTAGSDEKCQAARALGADLAINYRQEDFETRIIEAGGADIILDMVGGAYVQKNISVARKGGRIVNIAYMQGAQIELNLLPLMLKRLCLTGTTLRARPDGDKQRIRDGVLENIWPGLLSGKIRPVIDTVYAFDQAEAAHAHLTRGGHIGKILLSKTA